MGEVHTIQHRINDYYVQLKSQFQRKPSEKENPH